MPNLSAAMTACRQNWKIAKRGSLRWVMSSLPRALNWSNCKLKMAAGDGVVAAAGAAVAGAVAGAALSDGDQEELTQLRDRNTWLEERVAALEADGPAPAAEAPVAAAAPVADDDPAMDKLKWQAGYLRQRVDALEARMIAARGAEAPAEAAEPRSC